MSSPEKMKAPAATGAIENRKTNQFQEEGVTMTSTVPRIPAHFETEIKVAGLVVSPAQELGQPAIVVSYQDGTEPEFVFTTGAACALAAALQAVAVHVMEQRVEVTI